MKSFRRFFRLERTAADVNRSINDELAFHFESTVNALIEKGMTPEQAKQEAERRFGDRHTAEMRMAELDKQRIGNDRRAAWWAAITQDARYALRGLRMRPAFAATIIITLGLGIGANAAMFGIVDRLLFRPPAYLKNSDRVHRVSFARSFDGTERFSENTSYKRVLEVDSLTTSFIRTAAYFVSDVAVGSGIESGERPVFGASARFFEFFDAPPVLGRYFGPSEDAVPRGAPVTVLSYAYWQSAFGGRRDVINETIKIGTETYTIIGVAPPGLGVEFATKPALLIIPITRMATVIFGDDAVPDYYKTHNFGWVSIIAERKEGVSVEAATSDLTNAYRRSYAAEFAENPRMTRPSIAKPHALAASIHKDRGPNPRADSQVAKWLEGVAFIVLLIACANVANLLLARAVQRRREIAVRLALGVNRGRLIAQLLTESILLAGLGGLTGLAIAQWGGAALRAAFLPEAAWSANIIDPRTIVFTLVVSMIAGIISGLAPALYSGRGDVSGALKAGAREGTLHKSRTRTTLLIMQGALSVILLVGAGLFVRSLLNVRSLRMGYDVDNLIVVSIDMRGTTLPAEQGSELRNRLLARAKEVPGVENAARSMTVPFWMTMGGDVRIAGVDTSARWLREVTRQAGSREYFETMGTRILRGRGFDASDIKGGTRVIVVSDAIAQAAWPGKDALGQCVRSGSDTNPCRTVVGVAENITLGSLTDPDTYHYYLPIEQSSTANSGGLFVRVRGRAASQVESVRRRLQEIMPGESYVTVLPLSQIVAPETKSWRLGATMFVIFGALALGLAAVGLYSVIAYGVTQRQHELGVRVALGAQANQILSLILRQGMMLALAGVSIGALIAMGTGRWVQPLLYKVSPTDPLVYSGVITVLVLTALAACIVPARRAASVDPNVALRSD